MAVVGSGIMGERLAAGNDAIALLANTMATGAALIVLILVFGSISGAHFNPAVSLAAAWQGGTRWGDALAYVPAQIAGGLAGVAVAHAMFDVEILTASTHARTGFGQWLGEFVATFGLLLTIHGCLKARPEAVPYAVGLYITAAYWFTSSTSFANPAVTIARSWTDSFSGVRPQDAPGFIMAQLAGAGAAMLLIRWLWPAAAASVVGSESAPQRRTAASRTGGTG